MYIITIDGPASSGKSTVAHIVADKLNIAHINSGDAYRAIAYHMSQNGIKPTDEQAIDNALKQNSFVMEYVDGKQIAKVNGEDVTKHLHTNQINDVVSKYGANPQVIYKASAMAKDILKDISVVMEGRNLGSFCFPDAKYKFYVDCSVTERAKRRMLEMHDKGLDIAYDTIYKQVVERDILDKTRKVAPLVVPDGAVVIDSTRKTAEQVAQEIADIVLNNEQSCVR